MRRIAGILGTRSRSFTRSGIGIFLVSSLLFASSAAAGPIYVFTEKDGTIRFTNRQPPPNVQAKVFTAKNASFSVIRLGPSWSMGSSWNRAKAMREARRYQHIIDGVSREHRVDPALIKAVIHAESAFNTHAVSPKGALGLMQLMPGTARELGVSRPFAAEENIDGGTRYLARLLRKFSGNLTFALAAYNAGEMTVERYRGVPPFSETQTYVRKVLALQDQYRSELGRG